MPSTTRSEFHENTEGLEVAKAFAGAIRGKTVIVTGVNRSGIGFSTSQAFASQSPAHLIIAGRSAAKLQECIDLLKAEYPDVDYRRLLVDLSSQKSVRAAAAEILSWEDVPSINIVVNNAAVMGLPERTLSEEGIEMHFATNHIGHFLFTCSIMPKLIKAAEGSPKGATRVVNVSSASPTVAGMRWSDINFDKKNKDLPEAEQPNNDVMEMWGYTDVMNASYIAIEGYNQSKVANVLFSIAANKRLYEKHGILSLTVHPGIIPTDLIRNFPAENIASIKAMGDKGMFKYKSLRAGSSTSLVAALDPKLGAVETRDGKENYGVYLSDCQIFNEAQPLAVSSAEAERLWKLSEELVEEKLEW
ncbi:hypothetical protein AAE478_006432 [Parahypoxylon ruwenzoriense]